MIYGIDLGSTAREVDWNLLKENGVCFAIIKATQGSYRVNPNLKGLADGARKAGIVVGLYHWCDPLSDARAQADFFLQKTSGLSYDFAALDFEQYWADWAEWPARIQKKLSPQVISRAGQLTANAIRDGLRFSGHPAVGKKKVLVYTRASFIQEYAAPALDWLVNYPLWIAHWANPAGSVSLTWQELLEKEVPQSMQPLLPDGMKCWIFHQWSGDRYILPGLNGEKADLNRFDGTLTDLYAWLGLPQPISAESRLEKLKTEMERFTRQYGRLNTALQAYVGDVVEDSDSDHGAEDCLADHGTADRIADRGAADCVSGAG